MATVAPVVPLTRQDAPATLETARRLAETLHRTGYAPSFARQQPEWAGEFRTAVATAMERMGAPPS